MTTADDKRRSTADDERESTLLTAEDWAVIKANVERWAAKPIPDHIILKTRKIWNSVQ